MTAVEQAPAAPGFFTKIASAPLSLRIGATILIDDLKVGLSFASVTGTATNLTPIPLVPQLTGGRLVLNWANSAFNLQSSPAATGPFTNVTGAISPYTNPPIGPPKFFRLKSN